MKKIKKVTPKKKKLNAAKPAKSGAKKSSPKTVKSTAKKDAPKEKVKAKKPVAKKSTTKPIPPKSGKKQENKITTPIKKETKLKNKKGKAIAVPETVEEAQKTLKLSKADKAKYTKLLLELRDHLIDGVNFLSADNLKRTNRESSGELSGYSFHMADAGTDNFDREFALSLVSNEQEALYEIEGALQRLEQNTFGRCEMCEKQIFVERLEAVPFTRMCLQCQSSMEKNRRYPSQTTALFGDSSDDDVTDSDDSDS